MPGRSWARRRGPGGGSSKLRVPGKDSGGAGPGGGQGGEGAAMCRTRSEAVAGSGHRPRRPGWDGL